MRRHSKACSRSIRNGGRREARAAGADEIVFYTRENLVERVKALTGGRGVQVVYDSVGRTTFDAGLDCLAGDGEGRRYLAQNDRAAVLVVELEGAAKAEASGGQEVRAGPRGATATDDRDVYQDATRPQPSPLIGRCAGAGWRGGAAPSRCGRV